MNFERRLNRNDISRRPAYEEPENERLLNRNDISRRKAQPPVYGDSGTTDPSCRACNEPLGTADVDLSSFATGLVASTYYTFDLFCTGILVVLFTYDAAGVWIGSKFGGGDLTLNCDGEETPTSFTITLAVTGTGHIPGDVTITVTVGSDSWVWTNRESWQADQKWEFTQISGPVDCPCAPFRKKDCLVPVSAAA